MDRGPVSDADRVVRFLVDTARCGDCGGAYTVENVHVLDQVRRNVWELAAVCPGCLSVWLVRAVVRPRRAATLDGRPRPAAPGLDDAAGELSLAERRRFGSMRPIDVDDVLDVRAFLESFDGDFGALFGGEGDDSR